MIRTLIKETAEELKLPQAEVYRVVRTMFNFIRITLENQQSIRIKYLGVFGVKPERVRHFKRLRLTKTAMSVYHITHNDVDRFIEAGHKHTLLTLAQYNKLKMNTNAVKGSIGEYILSFPAFKVEIYSIHNIPQHVADYYNETSEELGLILGIRYKNGALGIVTKY